MSITDELRKWNTGRLRPDHAGALDAIADRIDKRHDSEVSAAERSGYVEAMDKVDSEYVKLPVDADGEIWTGNERVFEVGNGTRYDMRYLMYDGEKWIIDSSFGGFIANECHHVKPDSWERIIRDAIEQGYPDKDADEFVGDFKFSELVERCKKLAEKESHAGA